MSFFPNPRKLVPTELNEFIVAEILLKVALNTITPTLSPAVNTQH